MGFLNHAKPWGDVLSPELDGKVAPSLGGTHLGIEPDIYTEPVEFFKRTLVTRQMADVLENVVGVLLGRGGHKVVLLLSLFGGGKTHTLLTLYHAIRSPPALLEAKAEDSGAGERLRKIAEELSRAGGVRVAVLDGGYSQLAPTPVNPLLAGGHRIQTLWGSLAYQLGRFEEVKENDEKLLSPQVDVLIRVLGEKPAVVLVDEIADYVVRLKASGDQRLQSYADQVLSFMELLVKAVDASQRVALVVSLPAEEPAGGREELRVEERYKPYIDILLSLYRSVSRAASWRVLPAAPQDIPSILRVRIFESVDEGAARAVASWLARLYSENKDIFGDGAAKLAYEVGRTYPFHPSYIKALVDMVDKHEGLQKTRDAVRITRMVVRKLAAGQSPAELVMPFHIDVEDNEIRAALFSHTTYRGYDTVVSEDIIGKAGGYEKPELAKAIAKAVLVRTFVYAGLVKPHQIQLYPDRHEIVVSSFEPSTARALGLQPKDYLDALDWVSNNLVYMVSEGGRYWFTITASPIKRIEMAARNVDDWSALKKVEGYAQALLSRPPRDVVERSGRKGKREESGAPFNLALARVLHNPAPIDHDSRDYVLVVVLRPVSTGEAEAVIYETPSGGRRRYANTVYLVCPPHRDSVSQMLAYAKLLIACEEVAGQLDSLYEDKDVRDVMKKKLEKYCWGAEGVEGQLALNILSGLSQVIYPVFKDNRDTVGLVTASPADTIVGTVKHALKAAMPPKLYEDLDFDSLEYMLSQAGISLSEGETPRRVSDLVDYFYSNPRLPIVGEEAIKRAIIEGVKDLKVGVKRNGELFFKEVHVCKSGQECRPPTSGEGKAPDSLGPGDLVLPWRVALQEQLGGLSDTERRVDGGVVREWYAFYIGGSLVHKDEALRVYDPETLRSAPLVRMVEFIEEGVDIKLDRPEVEAQPGEEVPVTLLVERIGGFEGEVSLTATGGSLSPERVTLGGEKPSARVEWRVGAPREPGKYSYEVRAVDPSGRALRSAKLEVIVRPRAGCTRGVPPRGSKLSLLEIEASAPTPNLKPLKIIGNRLGSEVLVKRAEVELRAEIEGRRPRVSLIFEDLAFGEADRIIASLLQVYGISLRDARYRVTLKPRRGEYVTAPEFTEDETKELGCCLTYCTSEGG